MHMEADIPQVLFGAVLGLGYGIVGYARRNGTDSPVNAKRFARTVILFTLGGAIAAHTTGDVSEGVIEAQATALGGTLGVVFDLLWNQVEARRTSEVTA